jgi:hypothetical protein
MWYLYTMGCYSAIKKNEIAGKWMELEIIMLSEISQPRKDKYHVFSHMWNLDLKDMKMKGELFGKQKGTGGSGKYKRG